MPTLYVFVEGLTEQTYVGQELALHLAHLQIWVHPIRLRVNKSKGEIHRGGGHSYPPKRQDIIDKLKQHQHDNDIFVTTMIDLYAIGHGFPKYDDAEKLRHLPLERVRFLEAAFAEDIKDERFIPHFQLHEFEAMLFCEPTVLAFEYGPDCEQQIERLEQILAAASRLPEQINDGSETAPSKRIIREFPDFKHDKPRIGPGCARTIGLAKIRKMMPHFDAWLSRLESLGNAPSA
jgi:hypothetical protein